MILFLINYPFVCCPRHELLTLFRFLLQGHHLKARVESPHQLRVFLPERALLYEILHCYAIRPLEISILPPLLLHHASSS